MRRLLDLPVRTWRLLTFVLWYAGQLVVANISVARHVLSPRLQVVPGIARIPLRCRKESHLALLTGLVTLTPGTLVLDVGGSPAVMFVHGLHAPDPEVLRRQVQDLEERMLIVLDPES
jgi:multicomponent Na+:H+ antiporter subunit E